MRGQDCSGIAANAKKGSTRKIDNPHIAKLNV